MRSRLKTLSTVSLLVLMQSVAGGASASTGGGQADEGANDSSSMSLVQSEMTPLNEDDGDYRWGPACAFGSETRPAVTWRARQGTVKVTPPGAGYTLSYSTGSSFAGTTNGGLMGGGWWYVNADGDLDALGTFGSCTTP